MSGSKTVHVLKTVNASLFRHSLSECPDTLKWALQDHVATYCLPGNAECAKCKIM